MVSTLRSTTTAQVREALITRSEIALLDVREEGPFAEAHPLFAASLPLGRFELEIGDRVPRRSTRTVVYDNGEGLNTIAVERLRALGYTDVSVLEDVNLTVAPGDFAVAVFLNCSITETEGSGYLVLAPSDLSGEAPFPNTANINWWTSGITIGNAALVGVGGENAIEVACRGAGRTHFIIDLQGYIPFVP